MAVTDFQRKKWYRAAGQIVSGVLLIIALIWLLIDFGSMPEIIGKPSIWGFITMLFIFLIVWCFLSAAVNIVSGIITKKEPVRLSDVSKRIDALDKSIDSMGRIPTAAMPPQPKTDEDLKEGSKKTKARVIVVIAIFVIAAIVFALVFVAFNTPPEQGAASPEQAFNAFIDRINAHDAQGAVGKTFWALASNSSDYVTMVNQSLSSWFVSAYRVSGPTVFSEQMLNSTENGQISSRAGEIENELGVDVTEYVVIAFELSVSVTQGSMTISDRIPCVLVNEKWYLDVENLLKEISQ